MTAFIRQEAMEKRREIEIKADEVGAHMAQQALELLYMSHSTNLECRNLLLKSPSWFAARRLRLIHSTRKSSRQPRCHRPLPRRRSPTRPG